MDPLSITVSVLALLETAGTSARLIRQLFCDSRDAPAEIQSYCQLLDGLMQTFKAFEAFDSQECNFLDFPPDFAQRLSACLADLQTVYARIERSKSVQAKGAVANGWGRLKWSTVTEPWLKKFFWRLQMYHNDFVLVIAHVQLKVQLSIRNDLSSLRRRAVMEAPLKPSEAEVRLRYNYSAPKAVYHHCGKGYSSIIWKSLTYRQWPSLGYDPIVRNQIVPTAGVYKIKICINVLSLRYIYLSCSISPNSGLSAPLSIEASVSFPSIVRCDSLVALFARMGDIASIETMFRARRACPSDRLTTGATLLHIAVEAGHLELVKYLIVRGVDVNATDNFGNTPLHAALLLGKSYDIARILLEYGSDLGIQNISGRTPLHCWANSVVRRVLQVHDSPVDLYAADSNGMTIVHFMSRSKMTPPEHIRRLVENDVHCLAARDDLGYLPVHYALMRGNIALSSYLLERGIVPATGFAGASGASILHAAAQSSRTEAIDLALCHCTSVYVTDHQGRSAVHAAVLVDNAAAIGKIAELEASDLLTRPDDCGETPLQLARRVQAKSCVTLLELMGVVDTVLIVPAVLTKEVSRIETTTFSMPLRISAFQFPPLALTVLFLSATVALLLFELYWS